MEFIVDVVGLQACEKVHQGAAEKRPLLFIAIGRVLMHTVFDVVANALEEGVEQVFFVFEMPVQRATRHAGGLGDFVERGARDAFLVEGFQRGEHEMFFGFKGFGFGFPHDACFKLSGMLGIIKNTLYPCKHVCIMTPVIEIGSQV